MLRLLERNIASVHERLVLLPPPHVTIPSQLSNLTANPELRARLLDELQRLRGDIYLRDGALRPEQLASDGRHMTPEDEKSWHLLILDAERRVSGCIWYLEHQKLPALDQLRLRNCPLIGQDEWRDKLRAAVDADVARARAERVRYAEVGGWAVSTRCRPADCLVLALGAYSLSQLTGGALVVTTATARHSSAEILRRIGGALLQGDGFVVPRYYDPNYDCEMEILRFDSRKPNARYARLVTFLKAKLEQVQVVANDVPAAVAA